MDVQPYYKKCIGYTIIRDRSEIITWDGGFLDFRQWNLTTP